MLEIEQKEDSAEKLAAIAGKPTKNFLFAEEVNQIVQEVNNLEATINPDRLISLGTETIDVNEYTYDGYTWQLDGVQINNIGNPSIIVIPSATIGYKRNDISVFKADGTIERIAGTETNGEVVTTPDVPEGTLFYKSYSVNGNDIEVEPEPPAIDGTIYKKKIENTRWKSTQSGSNVVIPFQAVGQSHYSVVHSGLISVAGFSTALLTTPMYEGQDVLFENQTGNSITLKDMFGSTPVRFNLGADLLVPNGGKIWFKNRNNELELIIKSFISDSELPSYKETFVIKDFLVATNVSTNWRFRNFASSTSYTPTVLDSGTTSFITALTGVGTGNIPYQTHSSFIAPFDVKLKSITILKTDVFGEGTFNIGIGSHLKHDSSNSVTDGVSILEVALTKGSYSLLKKKYTSVDFGDITILSGHSVVVGWINQGRGIELYFEFEKA